MLRNNDEDREATPNSEYALTQPIFIRTDLPKPFSIHVSAQITNDQVHWSLILPIDKTPDVDCNQSEICICECQNLDSQIRWSSKRKKEHVDDSQSQTYDEDSRYKDSDIRKKIKRRFDRKTKSLSKTEISNSFTFVENRNIKLVCFSNID